MTATATDANDPSNQLTYSWEENDLGPASGSATTPDSDADGMARPIFRILPPTNAGATRNFPSLPYILNNANVPPLTYSGTSPTGAVCNAGNCITGEILPSIGRVMSFRVTVRDNNAGSGGAADALTTVTVDGATGPFRITAPNTNVTWPANSSQTVTWDVNGSNGNAANVKISLSTDGGQTFPTTILATTPNDGTEQITVPNVATTQARIKVEAVNNIFFDIDDANFSITGGTAAGSAANISTRLPVGTGDNLLITGFIITGPGGSTKKLMVRGTGPSTNLPGALANPTLELRDNSGALIGSNDNWGTTVIGGIITSDQVAEIQGSGLAPTNAAETALIGTVAPGSYTAQVRGANNTTGIGVAEAFDLSLGSGAKVANVSTRGQVGAGDNLMIAGFIIVNNPLQVVVRGIGPSLTNFGIPNALGDPTLELRDGNGALVLANDGGPPNRPRSWRPVCNPQTTPNRRSCKPSSRAPIPPSSAGSITASGSA